METKTTETHDIRNVERDLIIDYLRAINMLYILLWIHLLYWLPPKTHYKSWFLGEMVIVFFIMGASYSISPPPKYSHYLVRRIQRIFIPYFVYGCVLTIITILIGFFFLQKRSIKEFVHLQLWLNPFRNFHQEGKHFFIPFVYWHLWFIPTITLIIPFIPLCHIISTSLKRFFLLLAFMIIVIFLSSISHRIFLSEHLNYAFFYMTFVIIGFKYKELKSISCFKKILIAITSLLLLLALNRMFAFGIDMNVNKFPPNIMYLFFGFIWIVFITILWDYIQKIDKIKYLRSFLLWFSKYSYTAYLFHPFAYLICIFIIKRTEMDILLHNWFFKHFAVPLFILSIVAVLNMIFGKIEKVVFLNKTRLPELNYKNSVC